MNNQKTSLLLNQKFQTELNALREKYHFPGATAAYVLQDGTLGLAATGLADKNTQTPMTPNTRMLSASIGKTFVGATVIALVNEKELNLNTPISYWLGDRPWFDRLPNHADITLKQLLTHSSGLPDHVNSTAFINTVRNHWQEKENSFPPERLIDFILDQPALFPAGKGWAYSDTGYILIGLIIQQVTGIDYYDQIQKRFLTPLNLKFTSPANHRKLPGLAAGYTSPHNVFGFPVKSTTEPGVMAWNPAMEWTGGGLITTAQDLSHWGAALFKGQAMSGNYLPQLLNAVPIQTKNNNKGYGAGVTIRETSNFGEIYGHAGWIPGYISSLRYYPKYKVAIAFQINTDVNVKQHLSEIETRLANSILSSQKRGSPKNN
ncbi:serine hydrolase [Hydrogenovibrio sp. 3SP14C1]|uniref:serine hydrolase domain-containing protein n=1 Tax=Hydrogenovibrio sp. 3SP14C1 TaxID=3038774 RepID=UPI002417F732|nr:serine hydrolase domain-containing protein [Hydrogenovibrio sp. 3SP14C1]MDG4812537.1 serine hydrolase [Hydrogenovibrio sp. 3SP14C1]